MSLFSLRRDAPALVIVALMFTASAVAWPYAPDSIPVHFDASGAPDRYGGRFEGLLLMPLVAFGVWAVTGAAAVLDPGRANLGRSGVPFVLVRTGVVLFLGLMHAAALAETFGLAGVNISSVAAVGCGALFVAMGLVMGKIRPNYSLGIRTPWTLTSKHAWLRTHRLGGWLFVGHGLLVMIAAAWSPVVSLAALVVGAFVNVGIALVYSHTIWKDDPDKVAPAGTMPADAP